MVLLLFALAGRKVLLGECYTDDGSTFVAVSCVPSYVMQAKLSNLETVLDDKLKVTQADLEEVALKTKQLEDRIIQYGDQHSLNLKVSHTARCVRAPSTMNTGDYLRGWLPITFTNFGLRTTKW